MKSKRMYPESPSDTMMACFCLFLHGKESQRLRMALRERLLQRFEQLLDHPGHPAMRAFVKRLHACYPEEIGHFPELVPGDRLGREMAHFQALNAREGYIGDRFVFAYLFADVFGVNVELNEDTLVAREFCEYTVRLAWEDRRFSLWVPLVEVVRPPPSDPWNVHAPQEVYARALYRVRDGPYFVPPEVRGYRMHSCRLCTLEPILCVVSLVQKLPGDLRHYIFDEEARLMGVFTSDTRAFLWTQSTIYSVPAKSLEEARTIFTHEIHQLSTRT